MASRFWFGLCVAEYVRQDVLLDHLADIADDAAVLRCEFRMHVRPQCIDLAFNFLLKPFKPVINTLKLGIDTLKSGINSVESGIDSGKPPIDAVNPPLDFLTNNPSQLCHGLVIKHKSMLAGS